MKKKDNDKNQKQPRRYKFFLGSRERYILINCDFESGNIELIRQISEFQYRLASVHDGTNTDHRVNSKSWFYFSVTGFPKRRSTSRQSSADGDTPRIPPTPSTVSLSPGIVMWR